MKNVCGAGVCVLIGAADKADESKSMLNNTSGNDYHNLPLLHRDRFLFRWSLSLVALKELS